MKRTSNQSNSSQGIAKYFVKKQKMYVKIYIEYTVGKFTKYCKNGQFEIFSNLKLAKYFKYDKF